MLASTTFGLSFENIPLINLRDEFKDTFDFISSDEAENCLKTSSTLIETTIWTWEGIPDEFFNLRLQRSILGVEAYLPGALIFTSAILGIASRELSAKIHNPSSFASKSMALAIYHRMPAAVHEELSLKHLNQALYEKTVAFYREIRNPIFHGKQLSNVKIGELRMAFHHLAQLYEWIDSWCDPRKMFKSQVQFGPLTLRFPSNFLNASE